MNKEMTEEEKKNLMQLFEREFPNYICGDETEIIGCTVFFELYGKTYGESLIGYASYDILDESITLTEAEDDDLEAIAQEIYEKCLKHFPKIRSFAIAARLINF